MAVFPRGKRIDSTCVASDSLHALLHSPCPPSAVVLWRWRPEKEAFVVHRMPPKRTAPTRLITLTLRLRLGQTGHVGFLFSSHFLCGQQRSLQVCVVRLETLLMQAISPRGQAAYVFSNCFNLYFSSYTGIILHQLN